LLPDIGWLKLRVFPPSAEIGDVVASVGPAHRLVGFGFYSPAVGPNGCGISPGFGTCTIIPPLAPLPAVATYRVTCVTCGNSGEDANSGDEGDNSDDTP
jgi:hypothetical protein